MDNNQNNTVVRNPRKSRWSVTDTVLLLLVLVAVAGCIYRLVYAVYREEQESQDILYEVYFDVSETHKNVLAEIRNFDEVYLYENDVQLGNIGVTEADEELRVYMNKVTPITGTDLLTAEMCMLAKGTMTDRGLFVAGSGRYLTPGSELVVRTDRVLLTIRITKIEVKS